MTVNEITEAIIGAAIEAHRTLGPGLLESAYAQCLCHEPHLQGLPFLCEHPLPVIYKGLGFWDWRNRAILRGPESTAEMEDAEMG